MIFHIIRTGSSGNCTVIDRVMIDCGVPYKQIGECGENVRLVLLTHTHTDHIKKTALRTMLKHHPLCRVAAPEHMRCWLHDADIRADILDYRTEYDFGVARVICEPVPHNVPNAAWKIQLPSGERVLYVTDAGSIDGLSAPDYDFYFIEANYGEEEIMERIRRKSEAGEYVHEWDAMQNHLSREQADAWLVKNCKSGKVIYMHQHQEK